MIKKPSLLCEDYSYGHSPHFNQARRAWEEKQFPVKVRYLGSDLFKVILENGSSLQLHNHEPFKLLEHLEEYSNGQLTYSVRFQLLGVKTDGFGTSMFSMSAESLKPCQVTNKNKKTFGVFESDLPPGDSDGSLGAGSGSANG